MRLSISNGLSISGQQTGSAGGGGGAEAVSFGALTLAGAGGVAKPAGATAISDAGGTNLVLSSGFAVPDTGGTVTSGTVVWDDGTEWTVTAVANTYSAKADKTEIEAVHTAASTSATVTCSVREGTTADVIALQGKTFTGGFTLKGEGFSTNSAARPSGYTWGVELGGILMDGAKVYVEDISVYSPRNGSMAGTGCIAQTSNAAIANFHVKRCEMHSTPIETQIETMITDQLVNVPHQVAGFDFNSVTPKGSNGEVSDCYIHDTRFVGSGDIDNFLIEGVESHDTMEGWIVNNNTGTTGMIIKNCEHIGMWASLDDYEDQHSGMGGGSLPTGETGNVGQCIGNVVMAAGWRRRDYEDTQGRSLAYPLDGAANAQINMAGTTGFKLNDPNGSSNGYDGWVIKHNIFQIPQAQGMTVENGANCDWAYNTLIGDTDASEGSPVIKVDELNGYTGTSGLRMWKNITGGLQINGVTDSGRRQTISEAAYGNIQLILDATVQSGVTASRSYGDYFTGDGVKGLVKLTPAEMIAALAPVTGTDADTNNVGAINDYYTVGIPGKGSTDTSPAYDQPTSAGSLTANGHSYSRTVWDGTVGLELDPTVQSGSLTSDGVNRPANGKQLLIVGQMEFNASVDSSTVTLYEDGTGGITLQRSGTYGYLSLTWNRASDNANIVLFDTLGEFTSADGLISFAISVDVGNDRLCVAVNGKGVSAFNRFTSGRMFNDDTGDFQATNVHLLESTSGTNRFTGKLDFFGVDNSFVDLETDAGLETLFAADGTLLDLTSAGYLVALAGNAAAFNGDTGNSNGASQAALATGAGSVTDDDTTAPTLSSPTDAADGATASTGSVSTNEGNGTLYWVVTTSATAPSAAQVKAGQDNGGSAAADSGSQSVSGTGVQTLSPAPSGLTASTAYTTHFMHEDAAANQSAVSSASGFTTGSAGGITVVGTATGLADDNADAVITLPGTPAENDVVVVIRAQDVDAGTGMPAITGYTSAVSAAADSPNFDISWKRLGATPDTTVTVPDDSSGAADGRDQACIVYLLRGVDTTTAVDVTPPAVATGSGASATPPAITTATNGALVITAVGLDDRGDGTTVTGTPSGYSDLATQATLGGFNLSALATSGAKLVATAGTETPGAYTFSASDAYVAASIAFRPA